MTRESSAAKSKTDNHPNKDPDIFNSQKFNNQVNNYYLDRNINDQLNKDQNNQINDKNHINNVNNNNQKIESTQPSTTTQTTTTAKTTTSTSAILAISKTTAKPSIVSNSNKQNILTNKSSSIKDQDKANAKKINDNSSKQQASTSTTTSSYEAPYVKIFPLTPIVKNNESVKANNGVAFNNYAILTNKLVNSSNTDNNNKSLIENLGFNVLNKSIESPKQQVAATSKIVKLGQNKTNDLNKSSFLNNKNNSMQLNLNNKKEEKSNPLVNRTSIDLSKSNPGGNRLAFSLTLPKATEPTPIGKQEVNRKGKNKDDSKKLSCKKNPSIPACQHCSYGLFRCSMGKNNLDYLLNYEFKS